MNPREKTSRRTNQRGVAAVVMVLVLVVLGLVIGGLVAGGSRDQDLTVRRLETVRAFYAAESGMNMAIVELMNDSDEDGDGGVGSISDDGNDGNNPTIGEATVVVELTTGGGQTLCTSVGASGATRRSIVATVE